MRPGKWFVLLTLFLLVVPFTSLSAQDQPTISIALPSSMRNVIDESIFDDFESANGVTVYVNYTDSAIPQPSAGMDTYLDSVAAYASAADVLYLSGNDFSRAATSAGYFLDLSPLTSADSALNPDDFAPAAWASVQWDNAVWALPLSLDITMLIYDPDAFDKAGLSYPNERWTLDDLANAAKTLTQYDANGAVSVPGMAAFGGTPELFRSLYGKNFYDDLGNPAFTDPALEALLTQWQQMVADGIVGSTFVGGGSNEVPMRMMGSFGLSFPTSPNASKPVAVALPGGSVGLSISALAVSSGTQQPELAYKLAEYLTNISALANGPFGGVAARQSLASVQPGRNDNGGPGGARGGGAVRVFVSGNSPAVIAAVNKLLPDALTLPQQGYADYVSNALDAMSNDTSLDAHTALQSAEAQAVTDLQTAANRRSSVSVVVATPVPPVVLAPGEVALKFGMQSFGPNIANEDRWKALITAFSASDPDVGNIILDSDFGGATDFAQRDDCFYLSSNAVPSLDESTILNLDPYMDADSSFDPNDVVGGLMSQLQKDNHTWAYPLVIQAQTLSYNAQMFQQAGVPLPDSGWTIDQFNDALKRLKDYLNKAPFVPNDFNGESLMMLIAAYGGLPIDYRTTPATINFTDPATVDAIRQVLDLAKNGYMTYDALTGGGGFRIVIAGGNRTDQNAITTDSLGGFRQFRGGPGANQSNPYRLVSYPSGAYTGASYTIGTGYISATSQNPDACYRWLTFIAQHVDIFGAMPARLSQISDPAFAQTFGANVNFYQQYAQVLQDPKTIVFPSAGGGNASASDFLTSNFLNRAFDNYVSKDADLDAELSDAQTYAAAFQQCVAALPPVTGSGIPGGIAINTGIRDCATQVDSTLSDLFAGPGGG